MSSTIIKLRESEASKKNSTADFKITLDNALTLNNGDELKIKSVFLDTISASGDFIELHDPVDIALDVAKYLINDSVDQVYPSPNQTERMRFYVPADGSAGDADSLSKIGDAEIYFACNKQNSGNSSEHAISIEYNVKTYTTRMCGGFDLQFSYDKVGGGQGFYQFNIPRSRGDSFPHGKNVKHVTNIVMEGKNMTLLNTKADMDKHWIDAEKVDVKYKDGGGTANVDNAELDLKTFTMTIPKGIYTPTQLGELITDKMVSINSSGAIGNDPPNSFPVNNPFLGTAIQLNSQTAKTSFFCRNDGQQFLKYNDLGNMATRGEDRFIGASEVALTFDSEHKKMSFQIIHTPQFVNESAGQNNGVAGIVYDNNRLIDCYSGICFTRMSPPDFWTTLGFDGICITPKQGGAGVIPDSGGIMGSPIVPLQIGVEAGQNRTSGFLSLDTPVQKNANFRKPDANGKVSTNSTLPLLGSRTFTNDFRNEGYYLIELGCGIHQDLIGANGHVGFNSTKIHSIVSTYFSQGNFTSDQGTGSIGYIHKGLPIILSNFDIRVLNSDGQVPAETEIGALNTIFLELITQR